MIKKYAAYTLIAFFLGIAIFTSSQYVLMIKEKQDIVNNLQQIKGQLSQLESEKEALNQKLTAQLQQQQKIIQEKQNVQEALRINQEKYSGIEAELAQSQKRIEELNTALTALRQENAALQESRYNLATQVEQLSNDKVNLEARLGSIKELKKAIRELKKQMRKVKTQLSKKAENENLSEGNRGYIIKDGLPTYPPKVKIEVTPAL